MLKWRMKYLEVFSLLSVFLAWLLKAKSMSTSIRLSKKEKDTFNPSMHACKKTKVTWTEEKTKRVRLPTSISWESLFPSGLWWQWVDDSMVLLNWRLMQHINVFHDCIAKQLISIAHNPTCLCTKDFHHVGLHYLLSTLWMPETVIFEPLDIFEHRYWIKE